MVTDRERCLVVGPAALRDLMRNDRFVPVNPLVPTPPGLVGWLLGVPVYLTEA